MNMKNENIFWTGTDSWSKKKDQKNTSLSLLFSERALIVK